MKQEVPQKPRLRHGPPETRPAPRADARPGLTQSVEARPREQKPQRRAERSRARVNATTGRSKTQRAYADTPGKTKQDPLVGQLHQLSLVLVIGTKWPMRITN